MIALVPRKRISLAGHGEKCNMYKIGYPFWKIAARFGAKISIPVFVERDEESGVLIATSPSLRGLVVEAQTWDELLVEVEEVASMLIEEQVRGHHTSATPVFQYRGRPFATA